MRDIKKAHKLLFELPAKTDKVHAQMLQALFYELDKVIDPYRFSGAIFQGASNCKFPTGSTFAELVQDLPAPLWRNVVGALGASFPTKDAHALIQSFKYMIGIEHVGAGSRRRETDVYILLGLFDVVHSDNTSTLRDHTDKFEKMLCEFLAESVQKDYFERTILVSGQSSELSSAISRFFAGMRKSTDRWNAVMSYLKAVHNVIGDNDCITWNDRNTESLEYILVKEFCFKVFNLFTPAQQTRILVGLKLD